MKTSTLIEAESYVKLIPQLEYEENFAGDMEKVQQEFQPLLLQRNQELITYCKKVLKEFLQDATTNISNANHTHEILEPVYHIKYLKEKQCWRLECQYNINFTTSWTETKPEAKEANAIINK